MQGIFVRITLATWQAGNFASYCITLASGLPVGWCARLALPDAETGGSLCKYGLLRA